MDGFPERWLVSYPLDRFFPMAIQHTIHLLTLQGAVSVKGEKENPAADNDEGLAQFSTSFWFPAAPRPPSCQSRASSLQAAATGRTALCPGHRRSLVSSTPRGSLVGSNSGRIQEPWHWTENPFTPIGSRHVTASSVGASLSWTNPSESAVMVSRVDGRHIGGSKVVVVAVLRKDDDLYWFLWWTRQFSASDREQETFYCECTFY